LDYTSTWSLVVNSIYLERAVKSKVHGTRTARASPSGTATPHTAGKIKGAATGDVESLAILITDSKTTSL
jgi:hypothetical protein